MCEISSKCPRLRTANKDIVVYKVVIFETIKIFGLTLFERAISLIYKFSYKKNKVYTDVLSKPIRSLYHSSSSTGFYSYASKTNHSVNAKFVIPKGAKYYIWNNCNNGKVYVSDKIKYIGRI